MQSWISKQFIMLNCLIKTIFVSVQNQLVLITSVYCQLYITFLFTIVIRKELSNNIENACLKSQITFRFQKINLMKIRTILGLALLALLLSGATCQQSQSGNPGNIATASSTSTETSTKIWVINGLPNENLERTDKNGDVHQIHRWVDKYGNNHETDQWTDSDSTVHQCNRWIDSSKTIHETRHNTDKHGKVIISHVQKDKNGVVTDLSDKDSDDQSKPANAHAQNDGKNSAVYPVNDPPTVLHLVSQQAEGKNSAQPVKPAKPAKAAKPAEPANKDNVEHAPGCPNGNLQQNN